MIIELGHFALVLALAVALVQMALPAWGARIGDARLMARRRARRARPAHPHRLRLPGPHARLRHVRLLGRERVGQLALAEAADLQDLRRVGQPRGLDAAVGADPCRCSAPRWRCSAATCRATLRANVLAVQAGIAVAFLLFIVFTSNPFVRLPPQPEGRGLNPILQDPALAFHPPFLYAGYVGLSMAFSFAVAALIEGRTDAAWARWVRPWTLAAWMCLTLGIAMGSWWAYYELGWGGWWFWDPVENASFMPWLAATALLHSALVMEKREALKVWTILLAILAFSLSLMGTFLVRSGVLTSVHAFAVDPRRGVFILAILVRADRRRAGALRLARAAPAAGRPVRPDQPRGRAGPEQPAAHRRLRHRASSARSIRWRSRSLTGAKISVGPPYFNLTFVPLMVPLLLAMPFGPCLAWKRGDLAGAMQRLLAAGADRVGRAGRRLRRVQARALAGAVRHRARRVDRRRRARRSGPRASSCSAPAATKCWRRARGLPRSA